jgi:ATP-dependent DNA ligase
MPRVEFIPPMEARLVTELPVDNGWQFEPKWDGFRCVAVKDDGKVDLWAKSGKPLGRYFPEIEALVEQLPAKRLILDGELVVPIARTASFDALQQRLHPARSRVLKLAAQTPRSWSYSTCCTTTERPGTSTPWRSGAPSSKLWLTHFAGKPASAFPR